MPVATLRFNELRPERDHFELEDGTKIDFLSRAEMDVAGLARLSRILRDMIDAGQSLVKKLADEKAAAKAAAAQDAAVRFILPEISAETLGSLGMGQKSRLLEWWRERNLPAGPGQGKAQPG